MERIQVDASLQRWDEGFNHRHTRQVYTRAPKPLKPQRGASGSAVRERVTSILQRLPQVMVRISGGGKGMRHIRAHLAYIARHGKLVLVDQDGERYLGTEDLAWLGYSWQAGGVPIAEVSGRREALNIVLSMPAGTDPAALQRAVSDFARQEFHGHQYVMALHTFLNDPGKAPSPHPHVHLCVKMSDDEGRRLNPRKADLRNWREAFVQHLREHGISAAASSRLERFQPNPGMKQSRMHMEARGATLKIAAGNGQAPELVAGGSQRTAAMLQRYAELARILASSDEASDRQLAVRVVELCEQTMGRAPSRDRAR